MCVCVCVLFSTAEAGKPQGQTSKIHMAVPTAKIVCVLVSEQNKENLDFLLVCIIYFQLFMYLQEFYELYVQAFI